MSLLKLFTSSEQNIYHFFSLVHLKRKQQKTISQNNFSLDLIVISFETKTKTK